MVEKNIAGLHVSMDNMRDASVVEEIEIVSSTLSAPLQCLPSEGLPFVWLCSPVKDLVKAHKLHELVHE